MNKGKFNNELLGYLLARYSAEKKKIITVGVLLCFMGFMWSKVLSNKKDQQKIESQQATQAAQQTQMGLVYVSLPETQGRNDRVDRDFFAPESFVGFNASAGKSNQVVSGNEDSQIQMAAKTLILDAILTGESPEVFINDKLLKIGDILTVDRGGSTYEFELVKIMRNKIQLKCGETIVEIGMAETEK